MSATPADLFAALLGAPSLPGAKCRGRHHLFDEPQADESTDTVNQRQRQALTLCSQCPALTSCEQWVDGLPKSKRPPGVVAGTVNRTAVRGRPRRSA